MRVKLLKDGTASRGVEEGGEAGRFDARRAAGDGEGETALGWIEMGILGEGDLKLVTEGLFSSGVEEGSRGGPLAGLLQLGALG